MNGRAGLKACARCWRCRRAIARRRRHAALFYRGGARALLDAITSEREHAELRGRWKMRLLGSDYHDISMMRGFIAPSLIEYELRIIEFPSVPAFRRLH